MWLFEMWQRTIYKWGNYFISYSIPRETLFFTLAQKHYQAALKLFQAIGLPVSGLFHLTQGGCGVKGTDMPLRISIFGENFFKGCPPSMLEDVLSSTIEGGFAFWADGLGN